MLHRNTSKFIQYRIIILFTKIYIYNFSLNFEKKNRPFPATILFKRRSRSPLAAENPKLTPSEGNKQKCLRHSSPIVVGRFLTRAEPAASHYPTWCRRGSGSRDTSRRFEYYVYVPRRVTSTPSHVPMTFALERPGNSGEHHESIKK